MALTKISATNIGSNAVANSIGYTPVNKAGDTITGALTVSNTVTIANSTSNVALFDSSGRLTINGAFGGGAYDNTAPGIYFNRQSNTSETNMPFIRSVTEGSTSSLQLGPSSSSGSLQFITGNASTERMRIDSSGNHLLRTKKLGMGTYTGNSKEVQMLSWSGTMTNGTIALLSETAFGENGHSGIFGLNVMTAGKGVSRLYLLTGRYAACTMTMQQGGNRSAGEDAYLSLVGMQNTIGVNLTISGFVGSQPYFVWGLVGITTTYFDNWFSN